MSISALNDEQIEHFYSLWDTLDVADLTLFGKPFKFYQSDILNIKLYVQYLAAWNMFPHIHLTKITGTFLNCDMAFHSMPNFSPWIGGKHIFFDLDIWTLVASKTSKPYMI